MSDSSDVSCLEISSYEEYDDVVIYGIKQYSYEPKAENAGSGHQSRRHHLQALA